MNSATCSDLNSFLWRAVIDLTVQDEGLPAAVELEGVQHVYGGVF
jgi:hypothetical protein